MQATRALRTHGKPHERLTQRCVEFLKVTREREQEWRLLSVHRNSHAIDPTLDLLGCSGRPEHG